MHPNVTRNNISWLHFSWATLYMLIDAMQDNLTCDHHQCNIQRTLNYNTAITEATLGKACSIIIQCTTTCLKKA